MGNTFKIAGVIALVVGLVLGGIGAYLMFYYVPKQEEDAEFPVDFDDHFTYAGNMDQFDPATGKFPITNFTVDRHIVNTGELENGHYLVEENITATDDGSGNGIDTLSKFHKYEVHRKELKLYSVENQDGFTDAFTDQDDVNWMFPIPVDKDRDYKIWNMNILTYSMAEYQGTEERGGVDCYVFYGSEEDFEMPLPDALGSMLPDDIKVGTKMTMTLWEKAWVHPLTGAVVDYEKEVTVFLTFPELPALEYPSNSGSITGFDGDLTLFDQASGTFVNMNGITAERSILWGSPDANGTLTAEETVNVYAPGGSPIDMLGSTVQVMFDAASGEHTGMGRTGQYLFPLSGVGQEDLMVWDDGFGQELTAAYIGMDNDTFDPLKACIYRIDVEGLPYAAGGTADMEMTYWIEPTTGIVLDVEKHVWNWRMQDARRLPLDTAMINKTVHMNATVTQINPLTTEESTMEIVVEQMINCSGYTDMMFSVAKIEEKVTKLYMGMPMGAPAVARFGVDAVTMEYEYVPGWSTMNRTGLFTFPVGLLNETGGLPDHFMMYYSDLLISAPTVLTAETDFNGLAAAVYTMDFSDVPLNHVQLVAALSGQDPGLPGATGLYDGTMTYTVDIDTGTILDVERTSSVRIVPPTYEYLWDHLDSSTTLAGQFMGENITVTQTLTGAEFIEGMTEITVTETTKYDNGTDFLPPDETTILINTSSHEIMTGGDQWGDPTGFYFLFPPNPTAPTYLMVQTLGPYTMIANATRGDETDTTVAYNWTGETVADAALIGYPGMELNVTMDYNYLVDKVSGIVLDITVDIMLENTTALPPPGYLMLDFAASENTKGSALEGSAVMAWALSGMPVEVLTVEMEMYSMEVMYNVGKAGVTQNMLDIADGDEPALDLFLEFNSTTRETMKQTAQATLQTIQGLNMLKGMKAILEANDDTYMHVYYSQVDEGDGSIEYWGNEAKHMEDQLALFGTTIPVILFVVMLVLVLAGIALLIAGPKEAPAEEELPEDEEGEE
ncbi:MAG: DUF3068 domain-containing protein [Candidatus Thermoplasmatota archaeon]|nr:DUF3068 domain-containing protein [Candidatus Thermoplasmatota archaeon]